MSSFTKKYTDEEMNAALEKLLIGSERLETAVYCLFKPTGFGGQQRHYYRLCRHNRYGTAFVLQVSYYRRRVRRL